jgi:hypothetical protein
LDKKQYPELTIVPAADADDQADAAAMASVANAQIRLLRRLAEIVVRSLHDANTGSASEP